MTEVPLVQLIDSESAPNDFRRRGDDRTFADLIEPAGLREISTYAQVLAPHKDLVIPRTDSGALGEPTRLVEHAHRAGLAVQLWTFRAERRFLPTGLDLAGELARFAAIGIDGVFADHPDIAVAAEPSRPPAESEGLTRAATTAAGSGQRRCHLSGGSTGTLLLPWDCGHAAGGLSS